MEIKKIDPKIFINPPYIKCPKCGKNSFGILGIYDNHYCRRCRECFYPKGDEPYVRYPLPKLKKKIIYIDQFAISNMMKALNPETKAYKKGTIKKFWLTLFEKLDKLSKLQLIVCPYSESHRYESLAAPFYNDLKMIISRNRIS
jgi:hypothetical protein